MNILTAKEANQQKASKQFEALIERVIKANIHGLRDFVNQTGYNNHYSSKAEQVSYNLGWNKMSKLFPK